VTPIVFPRQPGRKTRSPADDLPVLPSFVERVSLVGGLSPGGTGFQPVRRDWKPPLTKIAGPFPIATELAFPCTLVHNVGALVKCLPGFDWLQGRLISRPRRVPRRRGRAISLGMLPCGCPEPNELRPLQSTATIGFWGLSAQDLYPPLLMAVKVVTRDGSWPVITVRIGTSPFKNRGYVKARKSAGPAGTLWTLERRVSLHFQGSKWPQTGPGCSHPGLKRTQKESSKPEC